MFNKKTINNKKLYTSCKKVQVYSFHLIISDDTHFPIKKFRDANNFAQLLNFDSTQQFLTCT